MQCVHFYTANKKSLLVLQSEKTQTFQEVNPWESQQSPSISSQKFTSSFIIHQIPPECYCSFVKSKCPWFPSERSSVTGWSLQLPQRPPLFLWDVFCPPAKQLWLYAAVLWEAEHPLFCSAVLYFTTEIGLCTPKYNDEASIFFFCPITNVVSMCV